MNAMMTEIPVCTVTRVWQPADSQTQYVDVQLIPGVKLQLSSSQVDFSQLVNNGHERYWRLRLQIEPYYGKDGALRLRVLNADRPVELAGGFHPLDKQAGSAPAVK